MRPFLQKLKAQMMADPIEALIFLGIMFLLMIGASLALLLVWSFLAGAPDVRVR